MSAEQQARDLLERMSTSPHWHEPQSMPASELTELANLFSDLEWFKRGRSIPICGRVVDGGRVEWTGERP